MMAVRKRLKLVLCIGLFAWLTLGILPACLAQNAAQILEATGVKGGLIVHINCGDGKLTAALRVNDRFMVHGLDADAKNVEAARKHVQSLGLYGKVAIDRLEGARLPYVDNMVNLVVAENLGGVPMDEVMRVLVPNGVAYIKKDGQWTQTVKPRPKDIAEWTHYLYDAKNNAVAPDQVIGPPRRYQWVGSPRWSRHHDHMASMSALVSANGRIFYIMDEGSRRSIQLPARWFLIARDAFNGVVLWKRPISKWNTHRWALKSGPAQLPRRLVAVGDRVYVTLGLDAPVSVLDAATGETIRTCKGTENTEELIVSDGVIFAQLSKAPMKWLDFRQEYSYVWANTTHANKDWTWDGKNRTLVALKADTGETLWKKEYPIVHLTLTADDSHVLFHDGEKIVCLNRQNGDEVWKSEPVGRRTTIPVSFGPTLLVYKDIVLFAGGNRKMSALSLKDGKILWTAEHHRGGHMSPGDLLVVDNLVWSGQVASGSDSGVFTGRDLRTGEVKSEFEPDIKIYWFHHRCYRAKATDNYILTSRTGIEFIDVRKKHWIVNHWVRGGCLYGIMPCNGMIYAPPHSCGCYLESKLCGFNALNPESKTFQVPKDVPDEGRLVQGPAYNAIQNQQSKIQNKNDWPTYRHDPARSGAIKTSIPADLKQTWAAKLGGRLSAVTVAGGKVYVATIDTHTVHALDAKTGKTAWTYTVGGRVDSPPTIYQGRALFGSRDGYVYCLRASDGALVWRFRAAPVDRRMMAYEQVESVWPVPGSVLVQDGVASFVAGRSIFLDDGMRLIRLDAKTGKKLSETILDSVDPETGKDMQSHVKALTMPVSLPDVLSSDGKSIYMRSQQFDMEGKRRHIAQIPLNEEIGEGAHLFCEIGFLDRSWFHRSYWLYGRSVSGGYGGWYQAARLVPYGRIMVFDDANVYGYGREPQYVTNASVLNYRLYAADKAVTEEALAHVRQATREMNLRSNRKNASGSDWKLRRYFPVKDLTAVQYKWADDQPSVEVMAMTLAGRTLFVAGPPTLIDERKSFRLPDDKEVNEKLLEQDAAWQGKYGGRLWTVSADDGKVIARYKTDSLPVFDGMAAANGCLFMSTTDGRVLCFGGAEGQALASADDPLQVISKEPEEPDYLLPPPVPKDEDFAVVKKCKVFDSKLGYRVRAGGRKKIGIALKKLDHPLQKKAVFETKIKTISGGGLVNGFIAFGNTPKEEQLVHCGLRVAAKSALIIQGPIKGGKSKGAKIEVARDHAYKMKVVVDLENKKVTLTVKKVTVEMPLVLDLKSITYVGYSVDSACTDFSPVKTTGE
ncbi:MAG: PQQ-binding-like beta-propeller repeat protein [Planctomycetes bacterium]|nr:PQQ-binding-like beta-propeller repeat protein [Planctomycetota bacterium]